MSKLVTDSLPYVSYGNVLALLGTIVYFHQKTENQQRQIDELRQKLDSVQGNFSKIKAESVGNKTLLKSLQEDAENSRALESKVDELYGLLEDNGIATEPKEVKPKKKPAKRVVKKPEPEDDSAGEEDFDLMELRRR